MFTARFRSKSSSSSSYNVRIHTIEVSTPTTLTHILLCTACGGPPTKTGALPSPREGGSCEVLGASPPQAGKFWVVGYFREGGWCGCVDHVTMSLIDDVEICRDTVVSFSIQPLSVDLCRNVPSCYQIMLITYQYLRWGQKKRNKLV